MVNEVLSFGKTNPQILAYRVLADRRHPDSCAMTWLGQAFERGRIVTSRTMLE
jgi:hypothetical protein